MAEKSLKNKMAPFRCFARTVALLATMTLTIQSAAAITARDVTDKMSANERYGYLTGIVDSLSYQSLLNGNRDYARCVSDAFYRDKDGMSRVIDALHAFPDKPTVAIIIVVMKRRCGK
jgi:hypothetical protein